MKIFLLLSTLIFSGPAFSQRFRIVDNKLLLTEPVSFKTATAELLPESETVLKNVKLFLDEKTFITLLRVEGHVSSGDAAQSQSLSEQRAAAVAKYLVKEGLACKRLLSVGFGNTKPIIDGNSGEKEKNNRMEFAIAMLNNRAIGGMPVDGGGKVVGDVCQ